MKKIYWFAWNYRKLWSMRLILIPGLLIPGTLAAQALDWFDTHLREP